MSVYLRERVLSSKARRGQVQFFLDCYHNPTGRRWHEALPLYAPQRRNNRQAYLEVRSAAEQIRLKREIDLSLESEGIVSPSRRKGNFVAFMESVHSDRKENPNRAAAIAALRRFTNGTLTFAGVTTEFIEEYQKHLLKVCRKRNTAALYFTHFLTALRRAQKKNLVSPSLNYEKFVKFEKTERRVLSIEDLRRLAATPCKDNQVEAAFFFSCYTGLRFSDVKSLRWTDISDGEIQLRQQKTSDFVSVPLSAEPLRILESQRAENIGGERVFQLGTNETANQVLSSWATAAGVKEFTFHASRHTFVTVALEAGAKLEVVSKLAGHRNISTTMTYAHLVDSRKRQAVAMLPALRD